MQNYFELFSLDVDFSVDIDTLEARYQAQISQFHPDKFVSSSSEKRADSLLNTSLINTAFDTLKSPLSRATYLLEMQGINAFDEKNTQMDATFLVGQIELREQLESIQSSKDELALDNFIVDNSITIKENVELLSQLFKVNDFDKITKLVRELRFYMQLSQHSNQLMDRWL
jgi:molecular chaperone HscB